MPRRSLTSGPRLDDVSPRRKATIEASKSVPSKAMPAAVELVHQVLRAVGGLARWPRSARIGPSTSRTVRAESCFASSSSRGAWPTGTYQALPGTVAKEMPRRSGRHVSPAVEKVFTAKPNRVRRIARRHDVELDHCSVTSVVLRSRPCRQRRRRPIAVPSDLVEAAGEHAELELAEECRRSSRGRNP